MSLIYEWKNSNKSLSKKINKFLPESLEEAYYTHAYAYPTPLNLNYMWGFGFLALMVLISQIVTGVLLAMHYNAHIDYAFANLEHIMRDVIGGDNLRYIHANGASMFFIVVYLHVFRGLFYGSYFFPRTNLWISGVIILFLMMATGFMGYVLPWGQMSFWGATVITNLFSAIPLIGDSIVQWLWGGYSVGNPTLNRFFSLHFLVPFVIVAVVAIHVLLLHESGSNNPLGIKVRTNTEKIPFLTYFGIKDWFSTTIFILFFSFFVINIPNYLGHPDNYIEAQPLVTPTHIVPEWYFLPYYAILRTIPDKLGGVIAMVVSILILMLLPFLDTSLVRSSLFKPVHWISVTVFIIVSVCLGWIGQEVVEYPFTEFSIFITILYFGFFFFSSFYTYFFVKD